ncbi:thioredoxin trx1 [Lithohypha guttulata]|uniref:Thioredoxin trx1 n=1 Tax=Lithohypha guttulata TaxID=1690604 RepID=A0AAN7YGP4_9EURO|nr:thioredoxin trx1 [Lithohypha guttulata]
MGVHNLEEYVAYHRQKLREENACQASTSSSQSQTPKPKRVGGVNELRSMSAYQDNVVKASGDDVVVIDFFATWCGPCKAIAPTIIKMSNEEAYTDKVKFYKIDVDNTPDVAQELGIRAMPTFVLFKGGEKIGEVVGADANTLRKKIDAALQ